MHMKGDQTGDTSSLDGYKDVSFKKRRPRRDTLNDNKTHLIILYKVVQLADRGQNQTF